MQEYTNRFNLPPEIVSILTRERYNETKEDLGDYSVTTLCAPIQQTILKQRYPDKLKQRDVIDNFYSFVGSIAHKVLEEHGKDDSLIEKRFYADVSFTKRISGQVDHYKDGVITDYKSTKAYKIIKGDFTDWEQQLNVYAWLAEINKLTVHKIRIFSFILDWKKHELYKKGYPQCPIIEITLSLWDNKKITDFINNRIKLLETNKLKEDNKLIECSSKEQWQDIKDFAIMKQGAVKATKCFDNEQEATSYLLTMKSKEEYSVVKRMTKRTRCFEHCPVSELCHQHKRQCIEEGVDSELQEFGEESLF